MVIRNSPPPAVFTGFNLGPYNNLAQSIYQVTPSPLYSLGSRASAYVGMSGDLYLTNSGAVYYYSGAGSPVLVASPPVQFVGLAMGIFVDSLGGLWTVDSYLTSTPVFTKVGTSVVKFPTGIFNVIFTQNPGAQVAEQYFAANSVSDIAFSPGGTQTGVTIITGMNGQASILNFGGPVVTDTLLVLDPPPGADALLVAYGA